MRCNSSDHPRHHPSTRVAARCRRATALDESPRRCRPVTVSLSRRNPNTFLFVQDPTRTPLDLHTGRRHWNTVAPPVSHPFLLPSSLVVR
jgi:hypothetical protein